MLNTITLVGRLTREPEWFKKNEETNAVANFALAFSQGLVNGEEDTGFIDCKAFGKLANTIHEWLSKGDKVAISGRIHHRKFQRKDGSNGSVMEILVDNLEFIDVLKVGNEEEEVNTEELPFEPAEEVKPGEKTVAKPTRTRR